LWCRVFVDAAITLRRVSKTPGLPDAEAHQPIMRPYEINSSDKVINSARKDFKHWCKDQWKIYKKSHKDD